MNTTGLSANSRRVGWLLSEKVMFLASTFFIGNWVAASLGPAAFGKFSIALSIAAVLGSVATLGLDTVLLRRFTIQPASAPQLLFTAITLRLLGAIAHVAISGAAALLFFRSDFEGMFAVLLVSASALFRIFEVAGLHLQAEDRYRRAVGIRLAARACADVLRLGLILTDPSIVGFALVMCFETFVGALLFFQAAHTKLLPRPARDPALFASLFREGLPVAISGVLAGLYARADQAVVFSMLGADANGQYAAAVRISELFNLLVVSVGAVAAPHFARLAGAPSAAFDQRLRVYARGMTALGVLVAIVVSLGSETIVRLLYGDAFVAAGSILRIHAWSIPLVFLSVAIEPWFFHYGKLDLYILKTVITLAVAVPLVWAGAWMAGTTGVAAALVAVYAVSVLGTNLLLPQARSVFMFQLSLLHGNRAP
jgi:PST family polysaccharide transporter